jgi:hypothetical protein
MWIFLQLLTTSAARSLLWFMRDLRASDSV